MAIDIATEISKEFAAEIAGMDFAARMSTSNSAARARVFARCPKSLVDAYLAAERADDRKSAAASDTRGTY